MDLLVHPSAGSDSIVRARHANAIRLYMLIGFAAVISWLVLNIIDMSTARKFVPLLWLQAGFLICAVLVSRYAKLKIANGLAILLGIASTAFLAFEYSMVQPVIYGVALLIAAKSLNDLRVNKNSSTSALPDSSSIMLSYSADMITHTNRSGNIISISANVKELLGHHIEYLHNHDFLKLVHISDRVHFANMLSQAIETQKHQIDDFRLVHANGARIAMEVACNPFKNPQTGNVETVITCRDIGHRLTREELSKQAQTQAESENVAKTRFLATMSHELRTPLNAILGFSDLMRQGVAGEVNAQQADYLNDVHNAGEHLLRIINDVLDVSKIDAGHYKLAFDEFEIDPIITSAVSLVTASYADRGVTIETKLQDHLGRVFADPKAIKQILINLLSNAVKFSHQGGKVTVSVERKHRGFILNVEDNGVGMSQADCQRIFQPFTQIDNSYSRQSDGTGLGMSIVKGFSDLHGATVKIDSQLGVGTTVSISMPGFAPEPSSKTQPDCDVIEVFKSPDQAAAEGNHLENTMSSTQRAHG